ncbi:LysR family transcriptional regulator [Thauera linaloolentis 47Lol = DSM 12138]|uniref:LysR family transcriptional regulator n=1 Tax=Thauera linaloolentis (strain DSM 12138 / JCM 21573 / CCUG 41526 / CIP 105981 / IAM 15112 / NBRC 102519 / 47Lol) TaxID=1123367 RepID=N6Y9N1_THAL4|nr:LysR family transcriptional regulator [Thauera linaloolentis 47Lol = DSM 12138]
MVPYRISTFDLHLFAAVVEAGSITRGAAAMHLSLAAASTRLQKLEHALGTALLHRSKLGIRPTDAGRTLLRHAGRLERELEILHAEMAAHAHGIRSTIRLLCNTAAMTEHLPPLIGRFLAGRADVDIDLRELGSQDVLLAMRQEQADIGIVADYVGTEGLHTRLFAEDDLVAVFPAESRPAGAGVPFADLLEHPFVGLPAESGLSRFLQGRAMQYGRGLHYRVRVRSFEAVIGLVGDGVGIAVVPAAAARRLACAGIGVARITDAWAARKLLLCTAGETPPEGRAAELLDFLARHGA